MSPRDSAPGCSTEAHPRLETESSRSSKQYIFIHGSRFIKKVMQPVVDAKKRTATRPQYDRDWNKNSYLFSTVDILHNGGVWGSSLARRVVSPDKELYSTSSPFTQVYKWVPETHCWVGEGGGGLPCDGLASRPGKSSNTPRHASC